MDFSAVSVITVVRNDRTGLERTLASVKAQDYRNYQLIVIDGGSTDDTLEVLHQYISEIDIWISEPDYGIYHAMNKSIPLSKGEWLIFMNAGDEFASEISLSSAVAEITSDVDVVYSDWIYREDGKLVTANYDRMNVRHQSVLYRKSLHDRYGNYLVAKKVTISDFIFFLSIAKQKWVYCECPISICDRAGASGRPVHFHQRMAAELLFGRRSRLTVISILLLHPLYFFLKSHIFGKR